MSIASKAKRSRISWSLGVTRLAADCQLDLLYKGVRGDLGPYYRPNSTVPWGPPEEFQYITEDKGGETWSFLRMSATDRDHLRCDLSLLHTFAGGADSFTQTVQSLVTQGKQELLVDYLNLLVKSEHFSSHDPHLYSSDGSRKDGGMTQENQIKEHGGDLEQYREFKEKAENSAKVVTAEAGESLEKKPH